MEPLSDCSSAEVTSEFDASMDVAPEPFATKVDSSHYVVDFVNRCNALIERVQWLFKLDQYTFDAYGYEYSGLGLWPVLVRPRVDHDEAKQLLLNILTTIDPYITDWVSTAERTKVGPHLAVLKVFRAAFDAYPAVRCWVTVHDALCRFLRVLLSTNDVNIYTLDCEILKYEREEERSGPATIVDAHRVRNSALVGLFEDQWLPTRTLSPVPTLEYTSNWEFLDNMNFHPKPAVAEDCRQRPASPAFESAIVEK